jgi:4-amino-4-deoxy-L-arabinose transferase-like glycosyltransferase
MNRAWPTIAVLLLVAGLTAFLRQPVVDDAFCDPDVAGAAYSAQEILTGGDLYGNTVETKPPLSYLMFAGLFAACGKSMVWVYLLSILWHFGVAACLLWLGRSMLGFGAAAIAAVCYAVFSTAWSANGPCPNFETWSLLPLALGFVFLWRASAGAFFANLLLTGVFAGVAVLAKQNVAVMPPLVLPWLWFALAESHPEPRVRAKRLAAGAGVAALGAALPLMAVALFFASHGTLDSLWRALRPGAALAYMTSEHAIFLWDRLRVSGGAYLGQFLPVLPLPLLMFVAYGAKATQKLNARHVLAYRLVAVWLVAALAAVIVGTKFFDHYFVLLMPPLALASGLGLWAVTRHGRLPRAAAFAVAVLAVGLLAFGFRWEFRLGAQAAGDRLRHGQLRWTEDADNFFFKSNLPRYMAWNHWQEKTGRCIAEKTAPDDTIYVWDYVPGVYWFADRRAPTRHFMYFNVALEQPSDHGRWHGELTPDVRRARAELLAQLHADPPTFIVTIREQPPDEFRHHRKSPAPVFDELATFLESRYERDWDCANLYLQAYRRVDTPEND